MSSKLSGVTIAVLGGDDRELILAPHLAQLGANVRVAGISQLIGNGQIQSFDSLEEAVAHAGFVILPMPGIDEKGCIKAKYAKNPLTLSSDVMKAFMDGCTVIVGFARPLLHELVSNRGLKMVEIADMDEVAVLNSIPSAEGAVQMAMEATDITVHGSNVIILGFGRCGMTLARTVAALGAKTAVVARQPKDLARITEMGMEPLTYQELGNHIGDADTIFNTVPALVLEEGLLRKTKPEVYICDIASAPGGVDFGVAASLGRKAELAPGLPGRVASRTAATILTKVIPDLIAGELTNTSLSSPEERQKVVGGA